MDEKALENFIQSCDDMKIATEMLKSQWNLMRAMQISKPGLANARAKQKKICENKLKECYNPMDCDEFVEWLQKQKRLTQNKINGKEIKYKDELQKTIGVYDEYLSKVKSLKSRLNQ